MSEPEDSVECAIHGKTSATFACQHLVNGTRLGFNCGYAEGDPDVLYPDAWCDDCEAICEEQGGWND